MKHTILFVTLFQISVLAYGQKQYYKSDTFNIGVGSISGISDDENLVLNLKSGYSTICLFRDKKLIQKRPLGGENIELRGLLDIGNLVHVFYGTTNNGKQQEGSITFYKDQSKHPTFKFFEVEENFLFAYKSGDFFNRVFFSKNENKLTHRTFRFDAPDSIQEIVVSNKELIKLLSRKEFSYVDSTTQDFETLASTRKAFNAGGKLVLLVNQDNSSQLPELVRVIMDFKAGTSEYQQTKHPFRPKTEHLSFYLDSKIFTWGLNLDYFALSIIDLYTLKSITTLLYLKEGKKIDLKATPINYSVGPPLNDKYWQWNEPILKRVDESNVGDILQQFLKGSPVFRAIKKDSVIQFLFGSYQMATQPTRTYGSYGSLPGGQVSSFTYGIQERRKFFYGFINSDDLLISKNYFPFDRLIRNRLDERIKTIFDDEKIGGLGGVVGIKKGYVGYLLKKEKELIIEEM